MPSKPSCSTGLVGARSYGEPGIELLLRRPDRRFLALARQDARARGQGEQLLADRVHLLGEVGELVLVADGAVGGQDVPGEHRAEPFAVQADRAVRVTWRVHHLE